MTVERICVVGLGYIGLPTAAAFASRKIKVLGVDINQRAVETINRGAIHFIEPDLDIVVRATVTEGYLRASTKAESADVFVIAVPTPFKDRHEPDLSYVEAASKSVASVLKKGDLVILESTCPVGATEQIAEWMASMRPDLTFPHTHGEKSDVRVAHCPERVLPGQVLRELVQNDRVIGGLTSKCAAAAASVYKIFVKGECVTTDARTAEMCKLTENSFRDVNIAFANELSVICDRLGINVWELIRLANRHPRVKILQPGPGVGGHCIAVDPWFIVHSAPEQTPLIRTARTVNDTKPEWVLGKVRAAIQSLTHHGQFDAKDIVIACLGLAFKADIDDLRESPAVEIACHLTQLPVRSVLIAEPNIKELPPFLASKAKFTDAEEAITTAHIVVLLVDHRAFKNIPVQHLDGKIVIDTRGTWSTPDRRGGASLHTRQSAVGAG
jgi:UDP-N-acetyl-D-mannosaminuronic acid dehydrogenase